MKKKVIISGVLLLAMVLSACGANAAATATAGETGVSATAEIVEPATVSDTTEADAAETEELPADGDFFPYRDGVAAVEHITMSDGAEICCFVAKPAAEGKLPVVVYQDCYQEPSDVITREYIANCIDTTDERSPYPFVEAGYALVISQTRGTANSEYESFLPYIKDTDDQLEILDWIREQDFYNGELFFDGGSYLGFTAMAHMADAHDDIKAISMQYPVSSRYDAWYQNGFMKLGLMGFWEAWMHRPAGFAEPVLYTSMEGSMDLFKTFPYSEWTTKMYGYPEEYWTDIITHPNLDNWWMNKSAGAYIHTAMKNINVPVLLLEGFYDIFYEDSTDMWEAFTEEQRARSAYLINACGHCAVSYDGYPLPYDESMPLDNDNYITDYVIDFFNSVRSGSEPKNFALGKVTFNPVNCTETFAEEGTLKNGAVTETLYLGDHTLSGTPEPERAISYIYDPNDPAYFNHSDENGDNLYSEDGNWYIGVGADVESDSRQDIISFLGEPAETSTFIKGKILADLTVSSDCEDSCFYVRVDLVKDGVAYNLREDITSLRAQYPDYTPGEKVILSFETGSIAVRMDAGDFLRVDVSSSAAGMYSLHTNVAGNQWEIAEPVTAHNTVYTGVSSITYYTEDLAA